MADYTDIDKLREQAKLATLSKLNGYNWKAQQIVIEAAPSLLAELVGLRTEVDQLRTDNERQKRRLEQFNIPLTGDPVKTWCAVCRFHYDDLPLHDYRRHGIPRIEDVENADLVVARDWAGRLGSMWRESPSAREEITARWAALAWCIEHVAALAAAVVGAAPVPAKEDE